MDQICIFPTVVSVARHPDSTSLNRSLERLIHSLPLRSKFATQQTDDRLHERPEMAGLLAFFHDQVAARFRDFRYRQAEFFVTSCWGNVQLPGGFLDFHSHSNSFLSGTYYVKAPSGAGDLQFLDPRASGYRFDIEVEDMNAYNAEGFSVPAEEGRLVLFPSPLMHGVSANRSQEPRISIAFNVMLRGELGNSARYTRLKL